MVRFVTYARQAVLWSVLALVGLWSPSALGGESEIDRRTNTAFLDVRYGMTTHKSLLVESNDTGTTMSYGFGVWAGMDRSVGMAWTRETTALSFALVEGTLAQTWEDMLLRYRWGPLYGGVIFGNLLMTGTLAGGDLFDARGSGYGVNLGFQMPVSRSAMFYTDVRMVNIASAMEQAEQTFTVTSRTDVDLGASIDITKRLIDFVFGYRYRTFNINTDSAYKELHTMTYLGVVFATEF